MVAKSDRLSNRCIATIFFAAVSMCAPVTPGLCQEPVAMSVLLDSLDPERLVDNEAVDEAFVSLKRNRSAKALANYAMSIIRIRQRRFDDAKALLADVPEAARRSPAFVRLQLWLSLQTGDKATASQAFDALIEQVGSDEKSIAETKDAYLMLAGTLAMLDGVENSPLSSDRIATGKASLAKVKDPATLAAIRSRGTLHREVSAFLNASMKEVLAESAETNEAARDTTAKALAALTSAYADAKQVVDDKRNDRRDKFKELTETKKELASTALKIKKDERKATPGHPGPVPSPPQRPQQPIEPTAPLLPLFNSDRSLYNAQKDEYDRLFRIYQNQLVVYQGLLTQYERDAKAFPGIAKQFQKDLAAWIKADQERREKLKQSYEQALADRKQTEASQKEMGREVSTDDEHLRTVRQEMEGLERKLAVLEAVASKDPPEAIQAIFVPANFPLIDLESEQRRVASAWKKMTSKGATAKREGDGDK
jgi:myosin heavy subunit